MDFRVETLAPCHRKVAVTVPVERVQQAFAEKMKEVNEQIVLPGFRKGRAPQRLLQQRFSKHLTDEVRGDLVKAVLEALETEQKLELLGAPEIDVAALDVQRDKPLELEFEVITKPEFETPVYKGLDVTLPAVEISDEEIQAGIDRLRRRQARLEPVDDAVVTDGDIVLVDYKAMDGDSVATRDEGVFYPFGRGVLANFVVEGLDDQLRGGKVGTQATAEVEVPADDPREDLRGKTLQLTVTVAGVQRYQLPEVDAEFLEQHDYDDVDELKKDVEKSIRRAKSRLRERDAEERLVEQLVAGIEMSLPADYVQRELASWARRKRMGLQVEKVEEEEIAKQVAAGEDEAKETIQKEMRTWFVLERIADAEKIQVTEADLSGALHEIAEAYGHPVEQVLASYRDGGRLQELASQIRQKKARDLIRREATIIEG
jgi:trigger factor